jgi:hypothetical protein
MTVAGAPLGTVGPRRMTYPADDTAEERATTIRYVI